MRKKSKKDTTIFIVTFLILISLLFVPAGIQKICIANIYNHSLELIDNESYADAQKELQKIEDFKYKDTSDLIKLCKAHISYDGGSSGAYMLIDDLDFEYQPKERRDKINAFIEKSRTEYKIFFNELVNKSSQNNSGNTANSTVSSSNYSKSSSTYKSKSYSYTPKKYKSDSYDKYNAKDYKFAEDFYDDHYDDFFDYEDAEDYYNDHKDD